MKDINIVDDYGRRTSFRGEELVHDSTDTGIKPQYTEVTVWRTEGGKYVVLRQTRYRVRHLRPDCRRATQEGGVLRSPMETDDFPCVTCNKRGDLTHGLGYGQEYRSNLTVYDTPQLLIDGLASVNVQTGVKHYSHFMQSVLADISEADPVVEALWMHQVIA